MKHNSNIEINCGEREIRQLFASITLQALHDYKYYLQKLIEYEKENRNLSIIYCELKDIHKYVESDWYEITSIILRSKFKNKLTQLEYDILGTSLENFMENHGIM